MKYVRAVFCIVLVAVLFGGCSFKMASSVNDLISPVAPFGDNADIQEAMNDYAKNGYNLKTPAGGSYKSSYSFFDIDSDGQKEAFAFYEPKDALGTVNMAILKKSSDSWSVVKKIVGEGRDVYNISFDDLTGDGKKEILVCWDSISNSTNHMLSVYSFTSKSGKYSLKQIGSTLTINNYAVCDMTGDDKNDLLVFLINSGKNNSAKAELYSVGGKNMSLEGETKLDSHITSYTKVTKESYDGKTRVYADAVGSDGSTMLTELIYWSDIYDTIISPFYSYSTGLTEDTTRKRIVSCMDVNNDKNIEIPLDCKKKLPKQVKAVNWEIYKNTTLIHSCYSLYVDSDNYIVVINDDYFDNISVKYDEKTKEMTVTNKETDKSIFSIRPVLKAVYSKSEYADYQIVMEKSGYYYLAKTGNDSKIKISVDDLKAAVKSC